MTDESGSFWDDLKEKLEQLGWAVAVGLVRWLLEKLLGNPGPGGDDADRGESD